MNSKDRNKYILLGVLGLVVVGVVIYQVTSGPDIAQMAQQAGIPATQQQPGTARPAPGAPAASAFVQTEVDINLLLASVEEVEFNYEHAQLARNPMTPRVGRGNVVPIDDEIGRGQIGRSPALTVAGAMVITAIVYDEAEPIAVLDNKVEQQVEVVGVGHEFPIGIIVESIEEGRVVLRVGDMRIPKLLEEQ